MYSPWVSVEETGAGLTADEEVGGGAGEEKGAPG